MHNRGLLTALVVSCVVLLCVGTSSAAAGVTESASPSVNAAFLLVQVTLHEVGVLEGDFAIASSNNSGAVQTTSSTPNAGVSSARQFQAFSTLLLQPQFAGALQRVGRQNPERNAKANAQVTEPTRGPVSAHMPASGLSYVDILAALELSTDHGLLLPQFPRAHLLNT